MNAPDPSLHPAIAHLDAEGRLIEGDARLNDLNRRAGGAPGQGFAVPEIAGMARLAGRLGIGIARSIVVADGEDDLDLWVRAEPEAGGVRIEASGWRPRPAWRSKASAADRASDFTRAGADWLWETDAALRITRITLDAGLRGGFDTAAMLGQPLTALFALAEDAGGGMPILDAVAGHFAFDDQDAEVRGTGRHVRLAATPRRDSLGRFAGYIGAVRSVDQPVVAAAASIGPASTGPASTVPEDTSFPPSFGERLGSALRVPLGRIIANADTMSAQIEGPLAPDYAGYAIDIANAGRHLLGLVDDLADLSAVERDDFRTVVEPVDLADVARRAAGLLAVRASGNQVRIDKPGFDDELPATGEFRRALQVLVNLIGNAVRYSPPDSVVWVRGSKEGDRACVVVADQGKGIAPADQARIFDKFGRVDPQEPGGSGLGLYISRRLARAMGGDITVDSAPGQGARFVFSLPIEP